VIRVGPAGWSYADWEGRVYPRKKPRGFHGLAYLARFVQVVEVDSTFYAPPRAEVCRRWVQLLVPHEHLRLTAKLNRDFTHRLRADSRGEIELAARVFLDGLEPLVRAHRLSALLVQLPHSFHHGNAELRHLGLLRSLFGELPLVLELRHSSWFDPEALTQIGGLGYSLAYLDLPAAHDHPPPWHPPTGSVGYLRLHGRNSATWFARDAGRDARYDYLYSRAELGEVAARARRISGEHDETFVVTNNHFEGKAVANALEIMAELRGAMVDGPAELVRAYPRLERSVRAVEHPLPGGQGELF
jgi:uncharacterized protein YecE (DUF72 family)